MEITASREDHNTSYSCAAQLDMNTAEPIPVTRSNSVRLEVLYKLGVQSSITISGGDKLGLSCMDDVNPGSSFQWKHNGVELPGNNNETLLINSVTVDDEGVYECIIRNDQGVVSAKMDVNVNVNVTVHTTFKQTCTEHMESFPLLLGLVWISLLCSVDVHVSGQNCTGRKPIIEPPALVVKYGGPATATCRTEYKADLIGWEAPVGATSQENAQRLVWNVSSITDLEGGIICYANSEYGQCSTNLPITIYTGIQIGALIGIVVVAVLFLILAMVILIWLFSRR
ncbi:irregular chiasm C-roughest protein-like [Sardina pilchardus]|uniref:irregular chiasm C-roughest protein-like n=1 Tax=Sardina pilchardus TaxID=27697 RepID=UPI002E0E5499